MSRFVIDEDMPRSTGKALNALRHDVKDVRDCGLRGANDESIFQFAQQNRATLLTSDVGFGNLLRFPIGKHYGIVIARFPNDMTTPEINRRLIEAIENFTEEDFRGKLIIVEPGKVRIRKSKPVK